MTIVLSYNVLAQFKSLLLIFLEVLVAILMLCLCIEVFHVVVGIVVDLAGVVHLKGLYLTTIYGGKRTLYLLTHRAVCRFAPFLGGIHGVDETDRLLGCKSL